MKVSKSNYELQDAPLPCALYDTTLNCRFTFFPVGTPLSFRELFSNPLQCTAQPYFLHSVQATDVSASLQVLTVRGIKIVRSFSDP